MFTNHFKYFGSWISFLPRDNFDTEDHLASDNSSIVALKNFIWDEHVDIHRKYVIFLDTPITLLLTYSAKNVTIY